MAARPQFRHYEELPGAAGRQIFFRAPRFRARQLFDRDLPLTVVDGHSCALWDMSLSGLSAIYETENGEPFAVGALVPVELRHAEASLMRAQGRVVRIEPSFKGHKFALQLEGSHADLDAIRGRYAEESARRDVWVQGHDAGKAVAADYRVLCTDVLALVRRYRHILDQALGANPALADDREAARRVIGVCEARAVEEWFRFAERGNRLIEAIDPDAEALGAMAHLTQSVLTPEFLGAPVWWQSYMKPFGYPGDFTMMNYVYEDGDRGGTLYDRFLHRIGLQASHFLYTRMEAMQQIIAQVAASKPGGAAAITSLACGSAEEVARFLASGKNAHGVHLTLIDQDERALNHAYGRAFPLLARQSGASSLRCLHSSFTNLMKGSDVSRSLAPQDLIYSVGLIDYLKARRAKRLVESLYERVAPGGLLVVGNLRASSRSCRWVTEMVCDWNLIFRTEADMLALVSDLHPESITLTTDSTDQIYLLKVRKPA